MKHLKKLFVPITLITLLALVNACNKNEDQIQIEKQKEFVPPLDEGEAGDGDHELGVELLSEVEYNKLPKLEEENVVASLPSSYISSTPSIKSQGGEGSCVAFGVAYSAYSITYKKKHGGNFGYSTNIFSPEFVYNNIKSSSSCSSGSNVPRGLNWLKSDGACTWTTMPYSSTNGCSAVGSSSQKTNAASHKIVSWSTVSRNSSMFKQQLGLYHHPVIIVIPVDHKFDILGNTQVYTSYHGPSRGNHCITIVGYDDSKHAFKVMNSWGTTWASSGYGWVDYNSITNTFCKEAYVITGVN